MPQRIAILRIMAGEGEGGKLEDVDAWVSWLRATETNPRDEDFYKPLAKVLIDLKYTSPEDVRYLSVEELKAFVMPKNGPPPPIVGFCGRLARSFAATAAASAVPPPAAFSADDLANALVKAGVAKPGLTTGTSSGGVATGSTGGAARSSKKPTVEPDREARLKELGMESLAEEFKPTQEELNVL